MFAWGGAPAACDAASEARHMRCRPPSVHSVVGRYYTGAAVAPVLTLFVGGNHEASNYLRELHYGGWVAPNIYYMGSSGVVRFGGLRIGTQ